jgi:hypothetical protein
MRVLVRLACLFAGVALAVEGSTCVPGSAAAALSAPPGALTQLEGSAGCYRPDGLEGCARAVGLNTAQRVIVANDGRSVYVIGRDLAAFSRNLRTGVLGQLAGRHGCVSASVSTCLVIKDFYPNDAAISADGRLVYVTSALFDRDGVYGEAIFLFRRDADDGSLTLAKGRRTCFSPERRASCQRIPGMGAPTAVLISPDGRNVYVAANGILTFAAERGRSGLRPVAGPPGCAYGDRPACSARPKRWRAPDELAVSRDGKFVYGVFDYDDLSYTNSYTTFLQAFSRRLRDGALSPVLSRGGCVGRHTALARRCTSARGISALSFEFSVEISGDGRTLYVGSGRGVAVFRRDVDRGTLEQLPGDRGCLRATYPPGSGACVADNGVQPYTSVTVSPDGRNVYFSYGIGPYDPRNNGTGEAALVLLTRDPRTGAVKRATGRAWCYSSHGSYGMCSRARGLESVQRAALSPDGRNLYAIGFKSDFTGRIAVFRRHFPK